MAAGQGGLFLAGSARARTKLIGRAVWQSTQGARRCWLVSVADAASYWVGPILIIFGISRGRAINWVARHGPTVNATSLTVCATAPRQPVPVASRGARAAPARRKQAISRHLRLGQRRAARVAPGTRASRAKPRRVAHIRQKTPKTPAATTKMSGIQSGSSHLIIPKRIFAVVTLGALGGLSGVLVSNHLYNRQVEQFFHEKTSAAKGEYPINGREGRLPGPVQQTHGPNGRGRQGRQDHAGRKWWVPSISSAVDGRLAIHAGLCWRRRSFNCGRRKGCSSTRRKGW